MLILPHIHRTLSIGVTNRLSSHLLRRGYVSAVDAKNSNAAAKVRRFYKNVDVVEIMADDDGFTEEKGGVCGKVKGNELSNNNNCFGITLDGRFTKTPLMHRLVLPNRELALAVASEWDAQRTHIIPGTMHLMGLCATAQDVPDKTPREIRVERILKFLETDTLMFPAEQPEELRNQQTDLWDPLLRWFETEMDVKVVSSPSIISIEQPAETTEKVRSWLLGLDKWHLTGVEYLAGLTKSLVVTTALMRRRLSAEEAVKVACIEMEYQVQIWGEMEDAHDVDRADLQARYAAASLFLRLLEY